MSKVLVRLLLVLVLTSITLTLATCISAEQSDYVRYDVAKDEFQMLMVLQDIRTQDADDVDFLQAIYRNRDHLIAPAIPGGANLMPLAGISLLRLSDVQFTSLNIFATRPGTLDAVESIVPLNTIRITPGTFFVQNNKLGYFQAIAVPGKTLDSALEEISKLALNADLVESIDKEINRRAQGGKVYTWVQAKTQALKDIELDAPVADEKAAAGNATASQPAASQPEEIGPEKVLDLQSLHNLKQAAAAKTLRLRRDRQAIVLSLPLTPRDAAEAADLYQQVLRKVDEVIAAGKGKPDSAEKIQTMTTVRALSRAMTATADQPAAGGGGGGLTMSLDLVVGVKAITALPARRIDMNQNNDKPFGAGAPPAPPAPPVDPIATLRDKKVPLSETLTAAQIIKDFEAGTLQAYPSEKPVKPGEGIIKPPEQTAPPPPAMP